MGEEQSAAGSRFGAAGPALGYLAQVDYALLLALRRMDHEEAFLISIETLDDIVFHHSETDDPTEKWQSKHSIDGSRSLSDASTDLWKTIHNWIVEATPGDVRLVLLATAAAGTIASKLRTDGQRDDAAAVTALERTARESKSAENKPYYDSFLALSPEARLAFVERIDIIDGAAGAVSIANELERALRKSVTQRRRAALVQRLLGWWHERAIRHLDAVAAGRIDRVSAAEIEGRVLEIADELRDENLPIDVLGISEPTPDEVSDDDRIFVAQLRLIAMGSPRLRKCIYDHNRAFAQRSIWQRDRLLGIGELGRYDSELIEVWERFFLPLLDEPEGEGSLPDIQRAALQNFARLEQSDLPPIRRDVRAGFVARGSLHVIADRLEIGWHPQWLEHLKQRLPEVREDSEQAA